MRVIAGSLGSREFSSPHGHTTHPMSDKIRGALFNSLGDIQGLTVLDAFAGSGALSFEAVSRGAKRSIAIEADRSAQQAIAENILTLDLKNQVKLVNASVNAWLSTTDEQFDIVLADPPYDNTQPEILTKLADRAKAGGLIVFSLPPITDFKLQSTDYELLSTKDYGDAQLVFYRRQA
jgi:16S rRNA (guanine966-N2)-methyltransferase